MLNTRPTAGGEQEAVAEGAGTAAKGVGAGAACRIRATTCCG